jgi:hypothetical protein
VYALSSNPSTATHKKNFLVNTKLYVLYIITRKIDCIKIVFTLTIEIGGTPRFIPEETRSFKTIPCPTPAPHSVQALL